MIRVLKASVSMSIQDNGRYGFRSRGFSRSGAMDPLSMEVTNRIAGALDSSASIEMGPGPCEIECTDTGMLTFGGARREGADWWKALEVSKGDRFMLSPPRDGAWSYLSLMGGIDAPLVMGSRSTNVREGIGKWIARGSVIGAGRYRADPEIIEHPSMAGPIRVFSQMPGTWRLGHRVDRMGYQLEGEALEGGSSHEWSEPILCGTIQLPPSGIPIVMMAEGSTVGGYTVLGVVHSEDLRLLAQARPGDPLSFESI